MRKNKVKIAHLPIRPPASLLKFIILFFILAALGLFFVGLFSKALHTSPKFTICDVITKKKGVDLSYLKGRNIFSVNLKKEADSLISLYPDYKRIKVIRVLPDRLFVDFVERAPLALVKLYRYFAVDEDASLFSVPAGIKDTDLPIIFGLETKIFGPKPGRKYNIRELNLALEIIQEARDSRILKNYRITKIDVSNIINTSFYLLLPKKTPVFTINKQTVSFDTLEVRIGYGDISQKMLILAGVVEQTKNDLSNMQYVDLRFKEPVIKLNNAK